jgi:hypothetical protein
MILIGGNDSAFCVHEELASLCSVKSTVNGEGLFLKGHGTLASLELGLGKIDKHDN